MARWVIIYRWEPEKTPEVLKRFASFLKGELSGYIDAFKRLNYITWEFPSGYGQTAAVMVVEGDEKDLSTVNRHWWDLGTFEILPCVSFDTIIQLYPDRIIHTLNP